MASERFTLLTTGGIGVVELRIPQQIDGTEFDQLNQTLPDAMGGESGTAWVLDLAGVEYTGSAMLGLIVNVRQRILQQGGNLVLCGLSSRLAQILHTCSLD